MKKILFMLLVSFHSLVFCYEISYTRTYNKIIADHNELSLHWKSDGTMSLSAPTFNTSPPKPFIIKQPEKVAFLNASIKQLLNKKANSLERKLQLIKSAQNNQRFYSSEVDKYILQISEGSEVLKKFEFSNFQELKHFYDHLGEWQPLIDVIINIENQIVDIKSLMKSGGAQ